MSLGPSRDYSILQETFRKTCLACVLVIPQFNAAPALVGQRHNKFSRSTAAQFICPRGVTDYAIHPRA